MGISSHFSAAVMSLLLAQCSKIGSALFLGFWSRSSIPGFQPREYIAAYAGLGAGDAAFTFVASYSMALAGLRAAFLMLQTAVHRVLRSPTSFHDRTPTGRITSRLAREIEIVDDELAVNLNTFLNQLFGVFGTFALIMYLYPILIAFLLPMLLLYYILTRFYRSTSRQIKRIDSTTRSFVISRFGEQIAGVASIRAFNQQQHFLRLFGHAVDHQNRFYYTNLIVRRWLSVRTQALGSLIVLGFSLFGVLTSKVSPAIFSVALTYTIQTTSTFGKLVLTHSLVEQRESKRKLAWKPEAHPVFLRNECLGAGKLKLFPPFVRQLTQVDHAQLLYYGNLQVEADPRRPRDPEGIWPSEGRVSFSDVQLQYREDTPMVLKGISFEVHAGEKVRRLVVLCVRRMLTHDIL
jgi:ABC-type multidrug transport system fused ATPase/permease subunit